MADVAAGDDSQTKASDETRWKLYAVVAISGGAAMLVLFSICAPKFTGALTVLFMASGAAFFVGSLLGFLFGIPKSEKPPEGTPKSEEQSSRFRDNANLEEVSDWLTKIIVGLGLVELTNILAFFERVGVSLKGALKMEDLGQVMGQGSVLYFTVLGFLCAYLWTRTEFYDALSKSRNKRLARIEEELDKVVKAEIDKIDKEFLVAKETEYKKRNFDVLESLRKRLEAIAKDRPLDGEIPKTLARYLAEVRPNPDDAESERKGREGALDVLKSYVGRKLAAGQKDAGYAEALLWRAGYNVQIQRMVEAAHPDNKTEIASLEEQVFVDFRDAVAAEPAIFARAVNYDLDLRDYIKSRPRFMNLNPGKQT